MQEGGLGWRVACILSAENLRFMRSCSGSRYRAAIKLIALHARMPRVHVHACMPRCDLIITIIISVIGSNGGSNSGADNNSGARVKGEPGRAAFAPGVPEQRGKIEKIVLPGAIPPSPPPPRRRLVFDP